MEKSLKDSVIKTLKNKIQCIGFEMIYSGRNSLVGKLKLLTNHTFLKSTYRSLMIKGIDLKQSKIFKFIII